MDLPVVVLWLFFSFPWRLGHLQMTPGWYAAYGYFGEDGAKECGLAAERVLSSRPPGVKAECMSLDVAPEPVAEPIK